MTATTQQTKTILRAESVAKEYRDGERTLRILDGVDLVVTEGEFVAIVGQSGSGKSTLLHLLGALDRSTSGEIELGPTRYSRLRDGELARIRSARIGFIYQFHHLLPEFSALENVLMPGMISGAPQQEIVRRAEELLRRVGLGERLTHRPAKLSGGEQQRVALARALLNNPELVLADEPTGNLDVQTSREVLEFLLDLTVRAGKSLVMVTHDPAIAARADRIFHLKNGRLETGPIAPSIG